MTQWASPTYRPQASGVITVMKHPPYGKSDTFEALACIIRPTETDELFSEFEVAVIRTVCVSPFYLDCCRLLCVSKRYLCPARVPTWMRGLFHNIEATNRGNGTTMVQGWKTE